MNYNMPIFIKLHREQAELMINVQTINRIDRFNNEVTHLYLNHRNDPLYVDESYEEIKKKLLNVAIIL